ncbi:hypothetical protein ASC80_05540 [Afipia sp. Root123D2]|nr:hypothetical protein ASC80_05540 [Afipia sp. Root123D2]
MGGLHRFAAPESGLVVLLGLVVGFALLGLGNFQMIYFIVAGALALAVIIILVAGAIAHFGAVPNEEDKP